MTNSKTNPRTAMVLEHPAVLCADVQDSNRCAHQGGLPPTAVAAGPSDSDSGKGVRVNAWASDLAFDAYTMALPVAWMALAIAVFVLGPLALFRRTRVAAGLGMWIGSWVIGLATWLLSSATALAAYDWCVLIIGWLLLGIGVVPIAIFAAFFSLGVPLLGVWLIVLAVATYVLWMLGGGLMDF